MMTLFLLFAIWMLVVSCFLSNTKSGAQRWHEYQKYGTPGQPPYIHKHPDTSKIWDEPTPEETANMVAAYKKGLLC